MKIFRLFASFVAIISVVVVVSSITPSDSYAISKKQRYINAVGQEETLVVKQMAAVRKSIFTQNEVDVFTCGNGEAKTLDITKHALYDYYQYRNTWDVKVLKRLCLKKDGGVKRVDIHYYHPSIFNPKKTVHEKRVVKY